MARLKILPELISSGEDSVDTCGVIWGEALSAGVGNGGRRSGRRAMPWWDEEEVCPKRYCPALELHVQNCRHRSTSPWTKQVHHFEVWEDA